MNINTETLSEDLEAEMHESRPIAVLDTEEDFEKWVIEDFGFAVYADQVFAKSDARKEGDYLIYVRGEGDYEGSWTQCC